MTRLRTPAVRVTRVTVMQRAGPAAAPATALGTGTTATGPAGVTGVPAAPSAAGCTHGMVTMTPGPSPSPSPLSGSSLKRKVVSLLVGVASVNDSEDAKVWSGPFTR